MHTKRELRTHFKELRETIADEHILERSLSLFEMVKKSEEYKDAKSIFCYISFGKEIETHRFLKQCLVDNKELCVPVVIDKSNIVASRINSLNNLMINSYGILEPIVVEEINKNNIDLIIVPALCYRPDGYRIGYGSGYYDNYLRGYENHTFGVTFNEFVRDFEITSNDIPVKRLFIV